MAKRIELTGVVGWDITVDLLKDELPKNGGKAVLVVDSEGGSVFEANRLFNLIKDHLSRYPNSLKVEYGALGASAASYFPLAVGVENISVRENTTWMAHKAWSFAIGNTDEMMLQAEILDGLDRLIARVYSNITGKSMDETLSEMGNELWLIGGANIVNAGFASTLIEEKEEEKNARVEKSEIYAKIEQAKANLKTSENKEDLNKWAAKLNDNVSIPPQAVVDKKEEDYSSMKLDEILNQNAEAKAEFETLKNKAVDDAIKNERERASEILNLSGLAVSDSVKDAFENGLTVGEFAVNEMKNQKKVVENKEPVDFGKVDKKNETITSPKNEESKGVKTMDDAINSILGKGDK